MWSPCCRDSEGTHRRNTSEMRRRGGRGRGQRRTEKRKGGVKSHLSCASGPQASPWEGRIAIPGQIEGLSCRGVVRGSEGHGRCRGRGGMDVRCGEAAQGRGRGLRKEKAEGWGEMLGGRCTWRTSAFTPSPKDMYPLIPTEAKMSDDATAVQGGGGRVSWAGGGCSSTSPGSLGRGDKWGEGQTGGHSGRFRGGGGAPRKCWRISSIPWRLVRWGEGG